MSQHGAEWICGRHAVRRFPQRYSFRKSGTPSPRLSAVEAMRLDAIPAIPISRGAQVRADQPDQRRREAESGPTVVFDMEAARRLIAKCAPFRDLDPEQRRALLARMRTRKFAARQPIFRMGDAGNSMMVVIHGNVRISLPSIDGKEVVLAITHPGEFFGELSMFDGGPRNSDATAISPTTVAVFERQHVLAFLRDRPDASLSILPILCNRLRQVTEQLSEMALLDLPQRLGRTLLRLRDAREKADEQNPREMRISQGELGNLVGATRESVNKCLREWQMHGIVHLDAMAVTIKDLPKLETLSKATDATPAKPSRTAKPVSKALLEVI